ncbi:MAG: sulfite exporter TauE/SafE family protein [Candidatus Woesebacteria bacterium]|nr:sulfite exporter TauE/SafE family protein [Candidatus Woesebacteria bacterium]
MLSSIWLPFITGLTTGGLSCFAVQGGLLTSALATDGTGDKKHIKEKSILMFLLAKLISYTILGFILGLLGSAIKITPKFQGYLELIVGLYMLATAARLLDIHPIFRYFVIQPPKAFLRLLRNKSQAQSFFTPALLGFLTVLIPCGITQAMMLLAIAGGNAISGASIMFFFVLGTSPVFFLMGLAAVSLLKNKVFSIIAAIFIAIMGIMAINSGQILRGSVHTIQNYYEVLVGGNETSQTGIAKIVNGKQEATIYVKSGGYQSDVDTLRVGIPVKLILISQNARSCARAFAIPEFNLFKVLSQDGTDTMEFTPTKLGRLTYTCSMGMYTGSFNVIK